MAFSIDSLNKKIDVINVILDLPLISCFKNILFENLQINLT